jgi:hypothetical protein
VLQPFEKNHNFSEKSFKNLLTNQCSNCNVRLTNDTLRPFREGRIMNDELRSEFAVAAPPTGPVVRQEGGLDCGRKAIIALDYGAKQVRKSANSHFSRILAFSPFFRWKPLPHNPFQLKQTGGFLGFPEKFSGGGIWGGGGEKEEL